MLHTINTLEVQLLVKDIIDSVCLIAAERTSVLKLEIKVSCDEKSRQAVS